MMATNTIIGGTYGKLIKNIFGEKCHNGVNEIYKLKTEKKQE